MLPYNEHQRKLVLGFQPLIDEDGNSLHPRKGPTTTQEEPWVLPADNPWKNPNETLVYQANGEGQGLVDVQPTRVAVEVKECWTPESTRQLQNMLFTKDVQKLCSPSPPVFVNPPPPPPPTGRCPSQGMNSLKSARPNGRKISAQVEKAANNFSRRMLASAMLSRTPLAKPQLQRPFDTESIISESSVESEGSSLEGIHHENVNESRHQSAACPPIPPTNSAASSAWKKTPPEEPKESVKKRVTLCGIRPKTLGVFLIGFGCGALSVIILVVTLAAVSDDVAPMATTDSPKAAGLIAQQKSVTRYNRTKGGKSLKDDLPLEGSLPNGTINSIPVPPSPDLKGSAPQINKNKTSGESPSGTRGNVNLKQSSDRNVTTSTASPLLPVTSPPSEVPTRSVEGQRNDSSYDDNKNKTSSTETERQGGNKTSELRTSWPPEESETAPPKTSTSTASTSVTIGAFGEEEEENRGNSTGPAEEVPLETTTVPQQSTASLDLKTTADTSESNSGDKLESEKEKMTTDSSGGDSLGGEEGRKSRAVPQKTTENMFTTPDGRDVLTTAGFTPPSVGNLQKKPAEDEGGPPQPTITTVVTPTKADSDLLEEQSADGKETSAIPGTEATAAISEGLSGATEIAAIITEGLSDATEVPAATEGPVTTFQTTELVETSTSKVDAIRKPVSVEDAQEPQYFTREAMKTTFVPPERTSTALKPGEDSSRLQLPLEFSTVGETTPSGPSSPASPSPSDTTLSTELNERQVEEDDEEDTAATSPASEVVVPSSAQNANQEMPTESSITGEPLVKTSSTESPALKDSLSDTGNVSGPVNNNLDLQTTGNSRESTQPSSSSEGSGANESLGTKVPPPPSQTIEGTSQTGSPEKLQQSTSNPRPTPPMTSSDEPSSKSKKRKLGWFEKAWRLVVAAVDHAKKVVKNPLQR